VPKIPEEFLSMLLKSIKLENIRSYTSQEINFPEGSVLLSGDIGSGKSSILLGIEFALFGIRRKHLDGTALLRHGKNTGSVELKFMLDGKEIIVKRTLKKSKDKVEQNSGYIIINGVKKLATAVELKTMILELLGYPKELITKTKNLVYRYTVYTPQEEMKEILVEEEEARLDTLRKVFGIDRYKRIGENCLIVTRNIKERRKELQGKMSGLEEKRQQKSKAEKETAKLDEEGQELAPKLESAKNDVKEKKEAIEEIEDKIKEFNSLKKEFELTALDEKNRHNEFKRIRAETEEIEKRLVDLRKEIKEKDTIDKESLEEKTNAKEHEIDAAEKRIREINSALNEFRIRKRHAEEVKSKILKISKCPTCEQEVSKEYKDDVIRKENNNIDEANKGMESYSEKEEESEKKLVLLKKELQELKKKESEISIIEFKKRELNEKTKRKEELLSKQVELKKDIGELYSKKTELSKKIDSMKDIEDEYKKLKLKLNAALEKDKHLEIEKRGIEERILGIKRTIDLIDKEILAKEKAKESLNYLGELLEWLEKGFTNLVATMEKQVMLNVYHEFNELFKKWFDALIEDETISVRLDDSFTPIVEQNGYEMPVANLSGGERTAAALAYRLALNKVVNDLMNTIKTKDLIILDEPTDGFSSEQLDRVREVLEQIGVKQTIIVSHESKIESFVDNVIRIGKNEHVSEVLEN